MMRFLRLLLLGLLLLALPVALLIAGGWWWLNSYVKTDEFRHEMEARLSRTLQGPVTIQNVSFDFFHGVELKGISYQFTSTSLNGNAQLSITQMDCAYSWRELLHGRIDLTKIALQQPNLVLRQLPPVSPALPETPAGLTPPPEAAVAIAPVPSAPASIPAPSQPASPANNLPLAFRLGGLQITDGTVTLQDEKNVPLVGLQKIQAAADTRKLAQDQVNGSLNLGEVDLPSNLKVNNFTTPYSYQHGAIQAKPFAATIFGGNLAGDYDLSPPLPSTLDLNIKGCDLTQITAALAPRVQLTGSLDLQSKWRALETGHLDGEGDIQVENGQLNGVPILQEVADLLKIKELATPTFAEAQSHFAVAGPQIRLTTLDVEGDIFSLTGDGTMTLTGDKPIDFNLVLLLRREAMEQLPKLAASSFVKKEDGTGSISFRVFGNVNKPETDLPKRLLSQNTDLQNVISNVLESFFHKHTKSQPAATNAPPAVLPVLTNAPPAVTVPEVTNAPPITLPPTSNAAPDVPKSATAN